MSIIRRCIDNPSWNSRCKFSPPPVAPLPGIPPDPVRSGEAGFGVLRGACTALPRQTGEAEASAPDQEGHAERAHDLYDDIQHQCVHRPPPALRVAGCRPTEVTLCPARSNLDAAWHCAFVPNAHLGAIELDPSPPRLPVGRQLAQHHDEFCFYCDIAPRREVAQDATDHF